MIFYGVVTTAFPAAHGAVLLARAGLVGVHANKGNEVEESSSDALVHLIQTKPKEISPARIEVANIFIVIQFDACVICLRSK